MHRSGLEETLISEPFKRGPRLTEMQEASTCTAQNAHRRRWDTQPAFDKKHEHRLGDIKGVLRVRWGLSL